MSTIDKSVIYVKKIELKVKKIKKLHKFKIKIYHGSYCDCNHCLKYGRTKIIPLFNFSDAHDLLNRKYFKEIINKPTFVRLFMQGPDIIIHHKINDKIVSEYMGFISPTINEESINIYISENIQKFTME